MVVAVSEPKYTAEMVNRAADRLEAQRELGRLMILWKYCPRRNMKARRAARRAFKRAEGMWLERSVIP